MADELKAPGLRGPHRARTDASRSPAARETSPAATSALRCADRLLIQMAAFGATDFEELFQQTRAVAWEELIPADGKMHVIGKSVRSKLASVPDCQAIVKKAVVEAMKRKYQGSWFPETGPVYRIEVALVHDRATLTVDTSGPGLHKRGYRTGTGEAPLKETLAAAMVLLSRWAPGRELADPFCGSGTIPIEAALIGRHSRPRHRQVLRRGNMAYHASGHLAGGAPGGALAGRRLGLQDTRLGRGRHGAEGCQGKRRCRGRGRRHIVPETAGGPIQVGQEIRLHRLQPALRREDRATSARWSGYTGRWGRSTRASTAGPSSRSALIPASSSSSAAGRSGKGSSSTATYNAISTSTSDRYRPRELRVRSKESQNCTPNSLSAHVTFFAVTCDASFLIPLQPTPHDLHIFFKPCLLSLLLVTPE